MEVDHSRKILSKKAEKASSDIKKFQKRKEEIESRIAEIDETYAGLSDQATNLKNSIDATSRKKTDTSMKLLQLLMQPIHNFRTDWDEVKSFHRRHSDWNLPADIGRGWISRLTEEELCICGRIMDDEHRKHIESNIDEYLDEGKNNEVSSMQGEFQ